MFRFCVSVFIGVVLLVGSARGDTTAADADFDGNGKVEIADFLAFVNVFGLSQGNEGYQALYDLNGNGTIDIPDFLIFVDNFGKDVSPARMTGDEQVFTLPGGASVEMVYIEPGTFDMGSPSSEERRENDEGPVHEVKISKGFYLGKYEVTQGQWEAVMGTTPWRGKDNVRSGSDYPAVYVSWEDAQEFIGRLNSAAGSEVYRLPTEAEWEYACRAGTTTRWSFGDDESQLTHYAWYTANAWAVGEKYGHRVGTKRANAWGLYDMHGNLWEWVHDWYGEDYYRVSPLVDPLGPSTGSNRIGRGGFFSGSARDVRSADRGGAAPDYRHNLIGFRILRQAD